MDDCFERIKRLASYLPVSSKLKALPNVILSEAGFHFNGIVKCQECQLKFESTDNLNLDSVLQFHLNNSPRCNLAKKCFEELQYCNKVKNSKSGTIIPFSSYLGSRKNEFNTDSIKIADLNSNFSMVSSENSSRNCNEKKRNSFCSSSTYVTTSEVLCTREGNQLLIDQNNLIEEMSSDYLTYDSINSINTNNGSSLSLSTGERNEIHRYQNSMAERLETFDKWPANCPIKPEELAREGFVYMGKNDSTKCVFCLGILCQWEEGDVPATEHKKHFPHCKKYQDKKKTCGLAKEKISDKTQNIVTFNQLQKCTELEIVKEDEMKVNGLRRPKRTESKVSSEELLQKVQQFKEENTALMERKLCKLCLDKIINTVFLPCGHLVSCEDCAKKMSKCAICRTLIRGTVLAFIPK